MIEKKEVAENNIKDDAGGMKNGINMKAEEIKMEE